MRAFAILLLSVVPTFAQGGAYRVGGGVTAPALLRKVEPEYSEEARKAHYQGTVLLYVEVNPEGKATNIRVQRALGLGLDEKAIAAVQQWQFKPGTKDGNPVTVAATIEVNFRLLNGWMLARQSFPAEEGVTPPKLAGQSFPNKCTADVRVTAAIDVDSNGAVTGVRILKSSDAAADQPVIDALRQWRFTPATWRGTPQPASGEFELMCVP